MRISDWSSDVCSSDLEAGGNVVVPERAVVGIGIEHRRRQRLQLAVGNIERRQVREHPPEHAGIAMSRELLQRRVGRLAPPGAMAGEPVHAAFLIVRKLYLYVYRPRSLS